MTNVGENFRFLRNSRFSEDEFRFLLEKSGLLRNYNPGYNIGDYTTSSTHYRNK